MGNKYYENLVPEEEVPGELYKKHCRSRRTLAETQDEDDGSSMRRTTSTPRRQHQSGIRGYTVSVSFRPPRTPSSMPVGHRGSLSVSQLWM